MKRKFRSFTAVLLALLMVTTTFSVMPLTVSAAEATEDSVGATSGTTGDCTWTLDDNGVLTISGNGIMGSGPWANLEITEAVIESGVTGIGRDAFRNCDKLTAVTIPNSVTYIGMSAFERCTALTSVNIPDSVTHIDYDVFEYCTALTSVIIPDSVSSIGYYAFYGCTALANITIPDSVDKIDFNALSETAWESIQPDGVIYAGKVLYKCKGTLPPNTSIVIKDDTKAITEGAFSSCRNITSVTIPRSIKTIPESTFHNSGLTSLNIPDSITYIGLDAFSGCDNLKSITVDEGNRTFDSRDNCNAVIGTYSNTLLLGCQNTVIPESVTGIEYNAFSDLNSLKALTIPNSVISIEDYAISSCDNLTIYGSWGTCAEAYANSHGIPFVPVNQNNIAEGEIGICKWSIEENGILTICGKRTILHQSTVLPIFDDDDEPIEPIIPNYPNNSAPWGAYEFSEAIIEGKLTSIGNYAFSNCSNLKHIIIPDCVTSIGNNAFSNCPNLTIYGKDNSYAKTYANSNNIEFVTVSAYGRTGDCLWVVKSDGELIIYGNGATCVYASSSNAPWKKKNITKVTIEDGVTKIGSYAFDDCKYLTSVTIPESVTIIGEDAFEDCNGLTDITLPDSITSIGEDAFFRCKELTSIVLPNSLTSIGWRAFGDCEKLTSIDLPDSLTSIGKSAFEYCKELTSITIPNSVVNIDYRAFQYCSSLEKVVFMADDVTIDETAFNKSTDNLTFYGKHSAVNLRNTLSTYYNRPYIGIDEHTSYDWTWDGCTSAVLNISCDDCDLENQAIEAEITSSVTKEPTCTEEGVRTYTATASFEGKTYTDSKTESIPATDHTYGEPVWTWDGYSAATATFTCAECDDVQEITANVTTEITKEPTCTETGIRTCTATVTFSGNTYTDTKEKTVPAKHSYSEPVWAWDGYSAATATFVCAECDDTQVKNANVTTKITTEPTCTETGIRTCTAKVTLNGKTYTDTKEKTISATGHSYGEPTWTWSGYSSAKATFTCAECNDTQVKNAKVTTKVTKAATCTETGIRTCTATITFKGKTYTDTKEKTIPAVHSYGEPTWTWSGYSSATATFTCADCDDTQVKNAKVTTKVTKEPTATTTGIRTCTATVTFNGTTYTDTKLKVIPKTAQSSEEPGSSIELPDDDPAPGALPFYVMGDANSDGVADIKDVTAIQCYLAGIKSLDSIGILAADVDGDEEVTIDDATEIQYYLSCFDFTLPIDSQVLF